MKLRILILIQVALFTTQLWASNWKLIGKNENVEIFIDVESLRHDNDRKKINSYRNILSDNNSSFKSLENEFVFNCKDQSYQELAPIIYSDYNRGGQPLARGVNSHERKIENFRTALGEMYNFACNSSVAVQTQAGKNVLPTQRSFKYINQLDDGQLQSLIKKSFDNDELYNNFLFNLAFINAINAMMQPKPNTPYDYLYSDGRRAFNPQKDDIKRNLANMLDVQREMASVLQLDLEKLRRSMGIKFDKDILVEEDNRNLSLGRLRAADYWRAIIADDDAKRYWGRDYNPNIHRPNSRLNDFYHSKSPNDLFNIWYPDYISKMKSLVIPNLIKLADDYEKEQDIIFTEKEKRAQWLQTPEGKRYVEKEDLARKNAIKAREVELQKKYSSVSSIIDMRTRSSMAGSCFIILQSSQNFYEADKASRRGQSDGFRFAEGMGKGSQGFSEAPANIVQAAINYCLTIFR